MSQCGAAQVKGCADIRKNRKVTALEESHGTNPHGRPHGPCSGGRCRWARFLPEPCAGGKDASANALSSRRGRPGTQRVARHTRVFHILDACAGNRVQIPVFTGTTGFCAVTRVYGKDNAVCRRAIYGPTLPWRLLKHPPYAHPAQKCGGGPRCFKPSAFPAFPRARRPGRCMIRPFPGRASLRRSWCAKRLRGRMLYVCHRRPSQRRGSRLSRTVGGGRYGAGHGSRRRT